MAEFEQRASEYSAAGLTHFFTMNAGPDLLIDATQRGNLARFINHSCNPNAETQKWLVRGATRIGIFTVRAVPAGDEITFDYKFVRFGQTAQRCLCREPNCKGVIGSVRSASGRILKSGISEVLRTVEDVDTAVQLLNATDDDEGNQRELLESITRSESDALLREFICFNGLAILHRLLASPSLRDVIRHCDLIW